MGSSEDPTRVLPGARVEEDEDLDPAETNGRPSNLIERLREARREAEQPHDAVLEVPGYEGLLGVRYKYVSAENIEILGRRLQREIKRDKVKAENLLASIDTLIACCDEVVVRDSEDAGWKSLADPPVRFDGRLADVLDYEASNARDAVLGLFNNEHAIIRHNIVLSRWLADTTQEVNEDFLGE